jgi:endogenous inhibitor of DNA gyrase (YacG/DUF329 family)
MARKCPTCGKDVPGTEAARQFLPFCSERCRTADLGKWLDGGYRIGTPISQVGDEELDQGIDLDRDPEA